MTGRDILEAAAAVAIGLALAATVSVIGAYADDRRYIRDSDGDTVGWIERSPTTGDLEVRDESGRLKYVIETPRERSYRVDNGDGTTHRFTPRKRWGSWEERWGK